MWPYLKSYLSLPTDRRGVTALEYGLMAALIGLAISAALLRLGTNMRGVFLSLGTTIGST